jgi:hypothetical protein
MIIHPIGQKFNRLTVLEQSHYMGGHYYYKCLCDCGNETTVTRNNLLKNNSKSCNSCGIKKRLAAITTLNLKENRYTYTTYNSMKVRCSQHDNYKHVPICDRWLEPGGFLNFLEDMGPRPHKMTLDRIDNSKGYTKDNCRWATSSMQNHNKSKRRDSIGKYIGVSACGDKFHISLNKGSLRLTGVFNNEEDAAVYYDNMSQELYGDRPNGTEYRFLKPNKPKFGGISFCNKSRKYRVRAHDIFRNRVTVGYFEKEADANEVLDLLRELNEQGAGYSDRHGT